MKNPSTRFATYGCLLLLLLPATGRAELADRDKPINLEADTVNLDDVNKVSVYQGNVQLSQGTLLIRADKLVIKEDAAGLQRATAYGNPASFRQKREGLNEYIEGYGLRIEYDARAEKAELFTQARMKRNQDEVRGNYISYDAKTEFFQVIGGGKEAAAPGREKGRVRAVIQPKPKNGTSIPPSAPLTIRGAENIDAPRSE
ncbi:MAG: lipopolysaccharide transport periplasmic protein LptA [Sulfurimicrobium sp.]|nr:lipopolysaccharide transport periplasmic protein LptA [Sulfurimicrobium sp.]MDO9189447.1 lipopolysaccharide transport periplasmic protein LptA [Sulfurimicrobium sp.]MDP1703708.1 lipopolysaccharide transport periplasmic protein LptA [Sulfurimicrobium sp.]MDP2198253.1 lipopolysaccharide transport periplasmic protein LptA [Sulfurimicrobium sp.]MDP3688192.1 lipopolysaccharide transport periplasmic protein LptA [Sulfurimicrobium sp.]